MTTDELREKYTGKIHFNCKDGDEAFTDGYVLWLEEQLISYHKVQNLTKEANSMKTPQEYLKELENSCEPFGSIELLKLFKQIQIDAYQEGIKYCIENLKNGEL